MTTGVSFPLHYQNVQGRTPCRRPNRAWPALASHRTNRAVIPAVVRAAVAVGALGIRLWSVGVVSDQATYRTALGEGLQASLVDPSSVGDVATRGSIRLLLTARRDCACVVSMSGTSRIGN